MDRTDAELIAAVLKGDTASFEPLVQKHSPRVFATVRRYARRESEIEDIAQEIWLKSFQKLATFRGDAPFEHWLMRLAVRTCYDFLRAHRRNREMAFSELTDSETDWLDRFAANPDDAPESAAAARQLVQRVLDQLSPAVRLIITLLEIEDRSVTIHGAFSDLQTVQKLKTDQLAHRENASKALKECPRRVTSTFPAAGSVTS